MQTLNLEEVFQLAKKEIRKSEKNNFQIAKELDLSRQMISLSLRAPSTRHIKSIIKILRYFGYEISENVFLVQKCKTSV